MKALVKTRKGVGHIEIRDVPEPQPGPGQVKIKIAACGVCGTDIHVRHDTFPYWPPVILGHELAGTVVARGADCRYFQEGDRVVAEPHTKACGQCYLCRTGNIQICPEKRSPGWGIDGAMTEYICYPEKLLHRIPDTMTWDQAVMVEPTANAVGDVLERTGVVAGDFVVVQGPGPIGLLAAMAARAAGARDVAIIGTDADEAVRLPKARELGFEHVINCQKDNAVEIVTRLSGGRGADLVVECSGAPAGIASTVDLVRKKGRICAIGLVGDKPVAFPYNKASFKVCDVHFCLSTSYTSWDTTIALVASGRIDAGALVTHRLPLERWAEAFEAIDTQQAIKAILVP